VVLRLDPSLLVNESYLAPYGGLSDFLAQHQEIAHNPSFFLGPSNIGLDGFMRSEAANSVPWAIKETFEGLFVLLGVLGVASTIGWLLRTLSEHRRWLRLSKVQTEAHAKLMDRLTSNQDIIAYVQSAIDAGLDVNQFGQRLSFFFNAHNDFLEEIAKFRAARRLWARIMRERFQATNPRAQQLRFHTQTAGSTLTAQQPDNNIVRVALQAMAAVLGGTQSLHCNGRDEALGLPTEDAARLALRTQQIIAAETGGRFRIVIPEGPLNRRHRYLWDYSWTN